ncbi:MAG: GGDEF domain-containing protein [Zoogloea sp.]|uniref:GGDEF domain-containing protein n=1 Tax=Zoogloea sp. TaxID=49181 RepID=UPI002610EC7D|nr:GGDEF domain-containing protein [Zoogloea sp.]MDD3325885.1 GGDEF domain-containing protein [Zoogloea sp.]
MIHVLKHVESITQHRDRSLLELGVASALFELVKAKEVNLYKVQAEDSGHFLERVTHVGQDGLRFNSEFEPGNDLIPVSDRPEMQACVEEAQIVRRHDEVAGIFVHCFPIRVERGVLGVLEVICANPLVDEDLGTAEGFLGLYRNYLNLLDYSERDTLTGLRNRKTFDENISKILGNISRPGGDDADQHRRRPDDGLQHWLAVVDVDHFKRVNDQFGHLYGDEVLLLLARIMRQSFRQQDKLFRFGGEEFVVVLRAATGAEVHRALERFRQAVEGYAFPQIGQVTASIGYTLIKPDDTIPDIVGRADDALYVAKESGRNQLANYETLLAEGRIAVREQPSSDIEFF